MKIIKIIRIVFYLLVLLAFLIFMTSFVAENNVSARLVLFSHSFNALPLSALLLIFFVAGGGIGLFASLFMVLKLRMQNASLSRKLKRRDDELKKLRVNTLKGLS